MTTCSTCGREKVCLECDLHINKAFAMQPEKEILIVRAGVSTSTQNIAEMLSLAKLPYGCVIVLPPDTDAVTEKVAVDKVTHAAEELAKIRAAAEAWLPRTTSPHVLEAVLAGKKPGEE